MNRLAIIVSHPIQYYAPLFRALAREIELHVFYAHQATPEDQARAGFGTAFDWDVDLSSGFSHSFLQNVARSPGTDHFSGCDTPEIDALLAGSSFGAVLVMGWHLKSYLQTLIAAKRRGIPVIVRGDSRLETQRSSLKRVAKSLLYPAFLRQFDAALYVGQRSRAYYEHYRYPSERLFFSPHSVDTARFAASATVEARQKLRRRLGIPETDRVLLFAGKLLPFKRPLDVIEAAARLRSSDERMRVMIAGAGPLQAELEARARALRVPLHALGFQNQSEMPAAYAAADVLVLPSTARETWGLVCNEALACGTPIVVSDAVGCAADLAADGATGRVFRLGDVESCATAVADILAKHPSQDAIAEKLGNYAISRSVDGALAAIEMVTRQRDKRQKARKLISGIRA